MKLLLNHADRFSFHVTEKTSVAEPLEEEERQAAVGESLVVFTAVEETDEAGVASVAANAAAEVDAIAQRLGVGTVVLYPYAHLSANLASPSVAVQTLDAMFEALGQAGRYEVIKAPFGWYKAFAIECKGHPLAELSREIEPEVGKPVGMIQPVETADSYLVVRPDGQENPPENYTPLPGEGDFAVMVRKEALHEELPGGAVPAVARLYGKLGIAWEPMSDYGHMRYGPKGALVFDLLADYSQQVVYSLGLPVFTVRGTNMFDLSEPAVREHAELFGDRLYRIRDREARREFVLRYAACHQQFAMIKDWQISYKTLPFGAFEIADSYRLEQSGECVLGFRTRRLYMPDLHVFCKDLDEAQEWFARLHDRIYAEAAQWGRDYEMLINFSSREVYEQDKDWVRGLLRAKNKLGLLHFYPGGKNYYWTTNIEYHIVDEPGRAREIGTVQIDVGNAQRFGITYTTAGGRPAYPVILHTAISGTLERFLYAILDTAVRQEKAGQTAHLPLWLNPEQVRLLSVTARHLDLANALAAALEKKEVRVGIDDRELSVSKKVREAKQDWVGYVIVIGEKEEQGGPLRAYDRQENTNKDYTLEALAAEIEARTTDTPFRPLYFARELSKRPVF